MVLSAAQRYRLEQETEFKEGRISRREYLRRIKDAGAAIYQQEQARVQNERPQDQQVVAQIAKQSTQNSQSAPPPTRSQSPSNDEAIQRARDNLRPVGSTSTFDDELARAALAPGRSRPGDRLVFQPRVIPSDVRADQPSQGFFDRAERFGEKVEQSSIQPERDGKVESAYLRRLVGGTAKESARFGRSTKDTLTDWKTYATAGLFLGATAFSGPFAPVIIGGGAGLALTSEVKAIGEGESTIGESGGRGASFALVSFGIARGAQSAYNTFSTARGTNLVADPYIDPSTGRTTFVGEGTFRGKDAQIVSFTRDGTTKTFIRQGKNLYKTSSFSSDALVPSSSSADRNFKIIYEGQGFERTRGIAEENLRQVFKTSQKSGRSTVDLDLTTTELIKTRVDYTPEVQKTQLINPRSSSPIKTTNVEITPAEFQFGPDKYPQDLLSIESLNGAEAMVTTTKAPRIVQGGITVFGARGKLTISEPSLFERLNFFKTSTSTNKQGVSLTTKNLVKTTTTNTNPSIETSDVVAIQKQKPVVTKRPAQFSDIQVGKVSLPSTYKSIESSVIIPTTTSTSPPITQQPTSIGVSSASFTTVRPNIGTVTRTFSLPASSTRISTINLLQPRQVNLSGSASSQVQQPKIIQASASASRQIQAQQPQLKTIQRPATDISLRQSSVTSTRLSTGSSFFNTFKTSLDIPFPKIGKGFGANRGRSAPSFGRQVFSRTPTARSASFSIKAPSSKSYELSGISDRPILPRKKRSRFFL